MKAVRKGRCRRLASTYGYQKHQGHKNLNIKCIKKKKHEGSKEERRCRRLASANGSLNIKAVRLQTVLSALKKRNMKAQRKEEKH